MNAAPDAGILAVPYFIVMDVLTGLSILVLVITSLRFSIAGLHRAPRPAGGSGRK